MPGAPFDYINAEFETELEASRLRRRFRAWQAEGRPLQRFENLDALIAFQRDRSIPSPARNEIALVLCSLAGDDEAAKLLLLRLYVPGLTRRWFELRKNVLPEDEVAAELVTGFLIRATKTHLGSENLSERLLGAAKDRVREAIKKRLTQLASEFATADQTALEAAAQPVADAAEEALASTEATDLLRQAAADGTLGRDHVEILQLMELEHLTDKEAAERIGIRPGTARVRRSRAIGIMRDWLRKRDIRPEGGRPGGV
jgi:DNA-directed RNA polymerase specialized sigma24 family protein